jgi:hypothetical protein
MGDLVNLGHARKNKVRDTAKAQATTNRAAFGRSKAQKAADRMTQTKAARALDEARREP